MAKRSSRSCVKGMFWPLKAWRTQSASLADEVVGRREPGEVGYGL
jgi:hypothetical protein